MASAAAIAARAISAQTANARPAVTDQAAGGIFAAVLAQLIEEPSADAEQGGAGAQGATQNSANPTTTAGQTDSATAQSANADAPANAAMLSSILFVGATPQIPSSAHAPSQTTSPASSDTSLPAASSSSASPASSASASSASASSPTESASDNLNAYTPALLPGLLGLLSGHMAQPARAQTAPSSEEAANDATTNASAASPAKGRQSAKATSPAQTSQALTQNDFAAQNAAVAAAQPSTIQPASTGASTDASAGANVVPESGSTTNSGLAVLLQKLEAEQGAATGQPSSASGTAAPNANAAANAQQTASPQTASSQPSTPTQPVTAAQTTAAFGSQAASDNVAAAVAALTAAVAPARTNSGNPSQSAKATVSTDAAAVQRTAFTQTATNALHQSITSPTAQAVSANLETGSIAAAPAQHGSQATNQAAGHTNLAGTSDAAETQTAAQPTTSPDTQVLTLAAHGQNSSAPTAPVQTPLAATPDNSGAVAAATATQPVSAPQTGPTYALQVGPADQSTAALPQPNVHALALSISSQSQAGAKQFDIRLDPPELGRVDVRLTVDSAGKAQAHLSADKPQTLELLQRDSGTLARALRDSGVQLNNNGLQFSLKGQGRQGNGSPSRGRSLAVTTVSTSAASAGNSASNLTASTTGVDIRV